MLNVDINQLVPAPQLFINRVLTQTKLHTATSISSSSSFLVAGSRNTQLASLAGSMRAKGATEEQILIALNALNGTADNPLPESEVRAIAQSIGRYDVKSYDHLTHQGFAKLFADTYGYKVRYCESLGFLIFMGTHWVVDSEGLLATRLLIELSDKLHADLLLTKDQVPAEDYQKILKALSKLKDATFLGKSLKLVKSDERIHIRAEDFKATPNAINFRNGTLDLNTMQLRPHDPKDYFRHTLPVEYDAAATCPEFDKVLADTLPPDHAAFLLRVIGYALSGTGQEQRMFFFIGTGQNGKSTLVSATSNLFGPSSVVLQSESLTGKMDGQIRCDLIKLDGAKLVITNETRQGTVMDSPLLKQITGGDILSARELHKPFHQFKPVCVPIIISNHFPVLDGGDFAMGRRICVIPFNKRITSPDLNLPAKLAAEQAGIMNRLLQGHTDYKANGLNIPPDIKALTDKMIDSRNLIKAFIEDCLEIGPEYGPCPAQRLYGKYTGWCTMQGYKPMSQSQFKESFEREALLEQSRDSNGRQWPSVQIKGLGGVISL